MKQRVTIIGLGVRDLKISNQFHEEKFGWKKMAGSNDDISFFQLNGILLSLYRKDKLAEDAGVNSVGTGFKAFNARTKEEVDVLATELKQKGVTIIKEPQEVFLGGYSSYITEPDGNSWEIAFNPFLPLDKEGNTLSL